MSSVLSYYTKFIRSLNLGHNIILDIVCNRCGETGLSVVVKDLDDPIAFEVIKKKMNGFLESHMGHGGYFLQSGKGKWKIPEVGFDEGKDDRPDLQETSKVGSLERTQEDLKKTKWESDPNIKEKRDKKNHTSVFKRKNGKNCDGCTVANHSFPNEIISGVAGEFADLYSQYIESPRIFLFFGFLVCLGSILAKKLKLLSERIFSPRYYILFLGESASDRKSTAIDTPVNFFAEFFPHTLNVCYGVGSAEGLQSKLKEIPEGKLLLCADEFKALINKCRIEGSVLLQCLNTLFENTNYESRTKTSNIKVENAHLSILTASTLPTYENMWTSQFVDIGFPNRIFIVPGTRDKSHPLPQRVSCEEKQKLVARVKEILEKPGDRLEMALTPPAQIEYESWYRTLMEDKGVHIKRLDTYALRFMPLLAINDLKSEVDLVTVKKTIALMEWEKNVRELYDPIDSTNAVAKMEEKIRRALKGVPRTTGDLKHSVHAKQDGIWIFNMATKNLSEGEGKEIEFNLKTKRWSLLEESAQVVAQGQNEI